MKDRGIGAAVVFAAVLLSAAPAAAQDSWSAIADPGASQGRCLATAVWTGGEMVVWGGMDSAGSLLASGIRYAPSTDSWSAVSAAGEPSARQRHTVVWTGREMIVWGGAPNLSGIPTNTGGRYDPRANTWASVSTTGAPSARHLHSAVWTGREMIVWGGVNVSGVAFSDGGRYDPATDTWSPLSSAGAPTARHFHAAVWSGREMLIWGGSPPTPGGSGARYDPVADAWTPMALTGAPVGRLLHSAAWTGRELLVWGGQDGAGLPYLNSGGRYDPSLDAWRPTAAAGAPPGRIEFPTVWTGRELLVWGGYPGSTPDLASGARYDPELDAWTPLPAAGAPGPRDDHVAVWTGREMILYGGKDRTTTLGLHDGGAYRPPLRPRDRWGTISTAGAPEGRSDHAAVWTGREMIVWGGAGEISNPGDGHRLETGGRYDFLSRTWSATSTVGAPARRLVPEAVWTGRQMLVFGGSPILGGSFGGRYDPEADAWAAVTPTGAPSARIDHSVVWTGREAIVWGGMIPAGVAAGDGARYDPRANAWSPVSSTGAPSPRYRHTAVWTGREMIVWGGLDGAIDLADGARYDPRADTWTPVTGTGAPSARGNHTAVWTGREMIVWGGGSPSTATGGRYHPGTDGWTATSVVNAPAAAELHRAVWTGEEMVVWGRDIGPGPIGGRYSPAGNSWASVTGTGAPSTRSSHTAVWTERGVAVWGGDSGAGRVNTGGTYGGDPTPPSAGVVRDGLGPDLILQTGTTSLSANWSGFTDPDDAILSYQWALGTTPGGTDVQGFLGVGTATSATASGLALVSGQTYYATVRASSGEHFGPDASSNGVVIGDGMELDVDCFAAAARDASSPRALLGWAAAFVLLVAGACLRRAVAR